MAARGQNDYLSSMIFNFISFVIGGNLLFDSMVISDDYITRKHTQWLTNLLLLL